MVAHTFNLHMDTGEILSLTFASLNMTLWIFVLVPQMRLNYKLQSSAGMSFLLVFLWLFGGVLSLISAVGSGAALMIICIGIHHLVKDSLLLSQLLYYRKNDQCTFFSVSEIIVALSFIVMALVVWLTSPSFLRIFAWSSILILSLSRVPQIILTFSRKSTEGLSFKSFIIVSITNLCFAAGIFSKLVDIPFDELVQSNLPWMIGCAVTLVCDIVIISQFFVFKGKQPALHVRVSELRGGLYDIHYFTSASEIRCLLESDSEHSITDTDTETDVFIDAPIYKTP